jgi:predicted nucleotidyltransferase
MIMPQSLDSSLQATLRNRLEELYPDRFAEAIIFGSYARGEAASNSDLDVLLVLKGPMDRSKERRKLAKLTTDLLISDETYVSAYSDELYR